MPAATTVALVYELPSMTVFERLAVSNVLETPSPRQTLVREVAVWGSAGSASEGFVKPVVVGCDGKGEGRLQGTVDGRLLRATGAALRSGVPSAFVMTQRDDGAMFVVRSTNGAPFRAFEAARSGAGSTACVEPKPPPLGCGSVIRSSAASARAADSCSHCAGRGGVRREGADIDRSWRSVHLLRTASRPLVPVNRPPA